MKTVLKIMVGAGAALIIPLLGNTYVDGWNWTWIDFLFAWMFWVVMGTTILFVTKRYQRHAWLIGTHLFLCFASGWALLATG